MLEESDTPLKKVASICGFTDQAGLRRAFMRRIDVTPVEYRQRFRPSEFAAASSLGAQASTDKLALQKIG
jgi:AraC-like DNA-binding protein